MRIRTAATAMFGLPLVLIACSSSTEPREDLRLSAVPTAITLDGQSVKLTAWAWRDFMPAVPPGGPPLIVMVSLPDHLTGVSVGHVWILYGDKIWEPAVEPTPKPNEWHASGIPTWGPGESAVEVVAQVRDQSGNQFLVRDAEVRVGAAY